MSNNKGCIVYGLDMCGAGVCNITTLTCTCNPGWGPDQTFFFGQDCTLPNGALQVLTACSALASVTTCYNLIGWFFKQLRKEQGLKTDVIRAVACVMINIFINPFLYASVLVQGGMGVATGILWMIITLFGTSWIYFVSRMLRLVLSGPFDIADKTIARRSHTNLAFGAIWLGLSWWVGIPIMLADAPVRNVMGGVVFLSTGCAATVVIRATVLECDLVLALVESAFAKITKQQRDNEPNTMESVRVKIIRFKRAMIVLVGNLLVQCVATAIVPFVLGSFPYHWIFVYALYAVPSHTFLGVATIALIHDSNVNVSGKSTTKTTNNNISSSAPSSPQHVSARIFVEAG